MATKRIETVDLGESVVIDGRLRVCVVKVKGRYKLELEIIEGCPVVTRTKEVAENLDDPRGEAVA